MLHHESVLFGKPRSGIADISNIVSFAFSKPRSGIADIADISKIVSFAFSKPRSGIADIADIINIAISDSAGFAVGHGLHHDGNTAKNQLEACSTTPAGGGPP
jgi:hypothetical protein